MGNSTYQFSTVPAEVCITLSEALHRRERDAAHHLHGVSHRTFPRPICNRLVAVGCRGVLGISNLLLSLLDIPVAAQRGVCKADAEERTSFSKVINKVRVGGKCDV